MSEGPRSGDDVATVNAVTTPPAVAVLAVISSSHPVVSAPTAGRCEKLIGAPNAISDAATNIKANFILSSSGKIKLALLLFLAGIIYRATSTDASCATILRVLVLHLSVLLTREPI